VKEEWRDVGGSPIIETFVQDLRYGLRQLRRNPGFTLVAVLTLALGTGANTTIFSAISAILLRKPPVKDPNRLCSVASANKPARTWSGPRRPISKSWQRQNKVFEDMAAARADVNSP
jgi:hypothetical protein